ncbi:MAG: RnfH family protein [Gammaproteobacteria bacterium]|nr:RnfH family protein [Gammaproteobacteria bacterium]MBV8307052.1 RnfH family protein [Gammaproteobacteria bacterium]MBV8405039.1 RnfH family protein [Gammaproteobacteria bacterium]
MSVAPPAAGRKRCTVAFATPARQYLWSVELAAQACIGDALAAARAQLPPGLTEQVPWDSAPVGIFGELRTRGDPCAEGDRIEIYRPLRRDPRERRRERVARERRVGRR